MTINFLPWRETAYARKQRIFSALLLMGLILAVVILWTMEVSISHRKKKIQQEQQMLSKQIQIFQEKNKTQKDRFLGDQKKDERLKWVANISKKERHLPLFLEKLGKTHLRTVYLTQIIFEKDQLNLKGVAASVLNIFHFMETLKDFPLVGEVLFSGAEKIQKQGADLVKNAWKEQVTFTLGVIFK